MYVNNKQTAARKLILV